MKSEKGAVLVKLVDFGESVQLPQHSSLLRGSAGTLQFMAPEVGRRVKPEGYEAFKAETWSFGCTLYCFYYLQPPIWADSLVDLFKAIETGAWQFLDHVRPASEAFREVIRKCLTVDADQRPTLAEVAQLEWFQGETEPWDAQEDTD